MRKIEDIGSYGGFFITKPQGNNEFSYSDRKNKSIYVPRLIDEEIDSERKISEVANFIEIGEDGVEKLCYGLKNMYRYEVDGKIIYLFDNHNHAFYFWCRSLIEGKMKKGLPLVHIDQHKDMRDPKNIEVDIDDIEDVKRYTNEVLNVGNFIKPALNLGIFSDVRIVDSSYSLELDVMEECILDIDLDFFSEDMDYLDFDLRIDKAKEYINKARIITVATSPYFIDQKKALEVFDILFSKSSLESKM